MTLKPSATHLIEEAMIEQWGPRCVDYNKGCHGCKAWDQLDALMGKKRRPNTVLFRSVSCPKCKAPRSAECLSDTPAFIGERTPYIHRARIKKYVRLAQAKQTKALDAGEAPRPAYPQET